MEDKCLNVLKAVCDYLVVDKTASVDFSELTKIANVSEEDCDTSLIWLSANKYIVEFPLNGTTHITLLQKGFDVVQDVVK